MRGFQDTDFYLNETYEYAFSAVPAEKRKAANELILILVGFAFSSSGITVGAVIGSSMTFCKAVATCFAGNLFLFAVACFWGIQGYRSGYSSVFWIEKTLGIKTARIFSVLVISAMIMWIGTNCDLLAKMVIAIFPKWPFPVSATAMMLLITGVLSASHGWRSIRFMSRILVPVIALFMLYHIVWIAESAGGFPFLLTYAPKEPMAVSLGLTMVVGNFSVFSVTTPNICRFAKNQRTAVGCIMACMLTFFLCDLCGILVVQATGANNLNYGIFVLGLVIQSFVWITLCAYTTQNVNLYTGSLALQNLVKETIMGGNISHRTAVLFIGGMSAISAVVVSESHLGKFSHVLVLTIIPLTGIAIAELCIGTKRERVQEAIPIMSWALGIGAGVVLWVFWNIGSWILPAIFSGIFYTLLRVGAAGFGPRPAPPAEPRPY